MDKIKIIANYLPQFHEIPENNQWWGKGFTDWVASKKSEPLYPNHKQPRIPLNRHYYDLADVDEIRWQAGLASKYNIYGFGIYHYWFSTEQNLLHKPAELIRDNKDIDIHYMFIWDNASWARTWSKAKFNNDWAPKYDMDTEMIKDDSVLAKLEYGDKKEWKEHFEYLMTFFRDERYIKIGNKPLFAFFQPNNKFNVIRKMSEYWNELAIEYGFDGIVCMSRDNWQGEHLQCSFKYAPATYGDKWESAIIKIKKMINKKLGNPFVYDYDKRWNYILRDAEKSRSSAFLSGFVDFDDTPRRARNATIAEGGTPQKFYQYMKRLMNISLTQGKEFVFVTAWNEWGESAYLEPDEINGYEYLEALKKAVNEVNG
ncbi:hypothetical protein FZ041_13955 [Selenomonas caprae]|uniref:Glycosyl transferase n=1 Tax=Selenomonas caprae TaxID=2606905 RepID=A0A5D6WFP0_9FIRM|nr:glycoside hydrolase family 99-like domain-containing protein [Selenomonas caprae]TYZ26677.1 hypothetical protein FZ041_13955 [Selenomonas caprae]